jgi:hypothetical protein
MGKFGYCEQIRHPPLIYSEVEMTDVEKGIEAYNREAARKRALNKIRRTVLPDEGFADGGIEYTDEELRIMNKE